MIYIFVQNKDFLRQIEYVFDNIFFILGLKYRYIKSMDDISSVSSEDILIGYGKEFMDEYSLYRYFRSIIFICDSGKLFGSRFLKPGSVQENIKSYKADILSMYNPDEELYVRRLSLGEKKLIKTNMDIIADIFFMLTRYEEVVNSEFTSEEEYNRFPGRQSLGFRKKFINRPVVNEDIELIWSWIDSFELNYCKKNWWGDKAYAVCISHDIDMILKYKNIKKLIRPTLNLLKKKQFKKTVLNLGVYIKSRIDHSIDPYWSFDYIIDKEKSCGCKSSFYFMTGGTSEFDNKYKINSPIARELIAYLEDRDVEVGYHPSFNTYNNYLLMKKEKEELDKIVTSKDYGCRQHFLRFQVPLTWSIQEALGLLYDTSLGFADCIGFRSGMCFPYRPYSLLDNRVINLWEIPLQIMDVTLFKKDYSSYNLEEAYINSKNIIEKVKQYGGVFTLLWHNSSLDPYDTDVSCWKEIYEKLMNYMGDSNCYGTDGRGLIRLLS